MRLEACKVFGVQWQQWLEIFFKSVINKVLSSHTTSPLAEADTMFINKQATCVESEVSPIRGAHSWAGGRWRRGGEALLLTSRMSHGTIGCGHVLTMSDMVAAHARVLWGRCWWVVHGSRGTQGQSGGESTLLLLFQHLALTLGATLFRCQET